MKADSGRLVVGAVFAVMLAAPASANTLRCEKGIISVGDSKVAVLQKCGEPQYVDTYCKQIMVGAGAAVRGGRRGQTVIYNNPQGNTCMPVDEWTYVPAPGQFMNTLRFESGQLTSVTSGDRVPY